MLLGKNKRKKKIKYKKKKGKLNRTNSSVDNT